MATSDEHTRPQAGRGEDSPYQRRATGTVEDALDGIAQWFSPDIALPFGRLQHRPVVTSRPRIDVAEKDHTLIVTAELPGVRKDELHVEIENGALVIRGEAHADSRVKDESYVRIERNIANYYRRLPLPFAPQAEEITANFTDGVLEVRIPEPLQTRSEVRTVTIS
jgi:HSP20 family protein